MYGGGFVFDINAKIGHWPFRPVKNLDGLLKHMDAAGIAEALVSSLHGVFYLNPQDANEELARCVAGRRDRLTPLAVLRPNFAAWEDDLARCVDEYGMRGIVLYPNYHRFELTDPALDAMADLARVWALPIFIQVGLEDPRRQFDRDIVLDVLPEKIGEFARRHPETCVVALGMKVSHPERAGEPLPANLFFDLSNYETMGDVEGAVERFGADKLLFGTNFPLFNVRANVDKLRLAMIDESERQAIGETNARRLLRRSV